MTWCWMFDFLPGQSISAITFDRTHCPTGATIWLSESLLELKRYLLGHHCTPVDSEDFTFALISIMITISNDLTWSGSRSGFPSYSDNLLFLPGHGQTLQMLPAVFAAVYSFLSLFKVRFYLHVTSYDICLSLNDSLCLEWSFLDPSMLLQMAFFLSFCGWVTFHCVSIPHRIYPFLCWWTFRLSLCLACCKLCCNERYIHLF